MIKSLLVAYDGSHGARVALQHAVDLARSSEGRILLLTVGAAESDDAALLSNGGVDPVALAADVSDEVPDATAGLPAEAVLSEALEVCRELTVRCLARPAYGQVAAALTRASRFSDLLLIGRDALAEPGAFGRSAQSARRVAASASCPVAVAPRQYQPVRSVIAVCPGEGADATSVRTACELARLLQVKLEALLIAADQLVAAVGDRQSPLIVVPRACRWRRLMHRDCLSAALQILNATVVVVP